MDKYVCEDCGCELVDREETYCDDCLYAEDGDEFEEEDEE
jgi:ribosomal protein L37AE/L43A